MTQHCEKLAGAEGFEPTNADSKDRCLTTWLRPSIFAKQSREEFTRGTQRRLVLAAPNRVTRKRAPTSFEFDRLNGALLSVLIFKNPEYCRAAAAEHCRARSRFQQGKFRAFDLRFKLKNYRLEIVMQRVQID
jgi:hypothetical protein